MPPKICLIFCFTLSLFGAKQRVEEVTTDRADVAPGSVIHIENSSGELNITGWNQPSVEIVATRYTFSEEKERTADQLKRIQIVKTIANNGELTISTSGKLARGVNLDYQIMVPRDARLVIHHKKGDVLIHNVTGDIDAHAHLGDIVVQLPQPKHEVIDARCRIGAIYSDFNAPAHHWAGSKLMQDSPGIEATKSSQHLALRVGTGGISIMKMAS